MHYIRDSCTCCIDQNATKMRVLGDERFTIAGKQLIHRTVEIFAHFDVSNDAGDWKWMKIDGSVFGDDTSRFNYYMHPLSRGFSVQLMHKDDASQTCYMFGMHVDKHNNKAYVYHHGHGPFKTFGIDYELA